jgi:hypothetical protein
VADELVALGEEDQRFRDAERIEAMPPDERADVMREAEASDRRHTTRLKEIVAAHGWPDATRFGQRAARAAFLIVQHADHDVGFQERMLPLLERAAEAGDLDPVEHAYLVDRVAVARGRPQKYGTQYDVVTDETGAAVADEQGRLRYLAPVVADPEELDARRAEVGLGPWVEYERRMADAQGREPFAGPRSAPVVESIDESEEEEEEEEEESHDHPDMLKPL